MRPDHPVPPPLPEAPWSVHAAAAWLDYDPATIRRLISTKRLKATKVGGQWRITRAAILELLEKEVE